MFDVVTDYKQKRIKTIYNIYCWLLDVVTDRCGSYWQYVYIIVLKAIVYWLYDKIKYKTITEKKKIY